MGLKKPTARNLLFVLIAIGVAKTFRINEIASCWFPLVVAREKSKQKRFLRFLETPWHIDALKMAWCVGVVRGCSRDAGEDLLFLLDETERIAGWKALVVAIPFWHRAIPVFWFLYNNQQIRVWLMDCFLSVMRRLPLHIGRRHIIVITEKLFLLLLLSNAFSRIYGTNTFLFPFSPRDTAEAIHSEFTADDCFSHIQT